MSTAHGAPAPYDNCPAGIEAPAGAYPSRDHVARFDAARTEVTRRRARPGHSCCYSWCADVAVASVDDVLPEAGCSQAGAIRESYCFAQLESGTSAPAPSPYDHCPLAIRPPERVSFSVPKAAPLDAQQTRTARQTEEATCCYGWCSRMPAGAL